MKQRCSEGFQMAFFLARVSGDCPARGDLVVCHHPHELKDLLPTGDEARAEHVVDAEGLAWRGGRRGGVVHNVRELLLQLQIVQNEAVAVVGYADCSWSRCRRQ